MIYFQIFWAFFISNILGYGGGPATIPLIRKEVVDYYHWLTISEFSEMLAVANALPGPITTKMAGYIGYQQGGILGSVLALLATIAPSLILMVLFLGIINKFKDSPNVKRMTQFIRPAIAVLMGGMTFEFFFHSYTNIGLYSTVILIIASFLLLEKWRVHPAFVIIGALLYGSIFLGST